MRRFRETNIWWIRLYVSFWLKFDLPRFIRFKGWNRARIWQLFIPASPTRFRALFVVRCPLFSGSKHARAWRLCARDDIYENRAVCTSPYRLAFSAIYQPRRPNKSRALSRYPWHDTVDNRSRGRGRAELSVSFASRVRQGCWGSIYTMSISLQEAFRRIRFEEILKILSQRKKGHERSTSSPTWIDAWNIYYSKIVTI